MEKFANGVSELGVIEKARKTRRQNDDHDSCGKADEISR